MFGDYIKPITTEMILQVKIYLLTTMIVILENWFMKKVYKFHNLVKKAIIHKHCDKEVEF